MRRSSFLAILLVLGLSGPAAGEQGSVERKEVEGLVAKLGDPDVPLKEKEILKARIIKTGKGAIPVLIGHLDDNRVYRRGQDVQNYYNLPPHLPTPPPILVDATVGNECRDMLYEIITPQDVPVSVQTNFKPFSFSILSVPDWNTWWGKNKKKSLKQIHEELKPLVKRYWEQHGTEQVVP